MASSARGAVSGGTSGTPFSSIVKRDLDRARYKEAQASRQAARDARSHKRGFGTFSGARVA